MMGINKHEINKQYCDFKLLEGFVNVIDAEKGTGKTQCIKSFVNSLGDHLRVLVVSPRQTLNRSLARTLKFKCYLDYMDNKKELHKINRLVCSPEQLNHLRIENNRYDVVIIDEVEQVLSHVVTSSTVPYKQLTAKWICGFCCKADTVVLADANVLAGTHYLVRKICEDKTKKLVKWKNHYKPRLVRNDKFYLLDDKDHVPLVMKRWIEAGEKFIVVSDNKGVTKQLAALAIEYGVDEDKLLLLNSDTTKEEGIAETLYNINRYSKYYDVILYSPTMSTGVSIDIENHNFKKGLVYFDGNSCNAESCCQMLARFRGLGQFTGWISKDVATGEPTDFYTAYKRHAESRVEIDIALAEKGFCLVNDRGVREVTFSNVLSVKIECQNKYSRKWFHSRMMELLGKKGEGFNMLPYDGEFEPKPIKQRAERKPTKPRCPIECKEKLLKAVEICCECIDDLRNKDLEEEKRTRTEGLITDRVQKQTVKQEFYKKVFELLGVTYTDGLSYIPDRRLDTIPYEQLEKFVPLYKTVMKGKLAMNVVTAIGQLAKSVGLETYYKQKNSDKKRKYFLNGKLIDDINKG